ncbi:hypothetical protein L5515_010268 [Caenorhabditis briggsae]|uniref:K Homology domain-containing protein n=1 Tax=Caenorhabditis briggsae TaxID=6238 RepID=A0AAE9EQQ4_CAEBR|nr:hypothetical protein L5515_010268 [Caenorhabditis briggsae]
MITNPGKSWVGDPGTHCHVARPPMGDPLTSKGSQLNSFDQSELSSDHKPSKSINKMNTSNIDSLSDGIQHLRLAEKFSPLMTPPPSETKSLKSTSNHSEHEKHDKNAYIESLKEEREQLSHCSDGFNHVFTLIDKEIKRIGGEGDRHEAAVPGAPATLSEIIMVPVEQYPTYNFVGRILGPRGTTAKQLESTTGCRVTILGRNKKDKDGNTSSVDVSSPPDNGPLRVEVSVPADAPDAVRRMETGVSVVKALLIPPADGQDELKRQQLMVLANLNGTYRPRTATPSIPSLQFTGAGDYGHPFQNLLPYGYRLPVQKSSSYGAHDSSAKQDCYNPKCAILRGLIEQNRPQQSGPIPKVEDVLSVMHMYELMNRIRIANSSLTGNQSKAQEIGNRMCASIGVRSPSATSSSTTSPLTRRQYKPRPQSSSNNQNH